MAGTVLLFRDDGERPHCEVALASGERVALTLDAKSLAIARLDVSEREAETLFQARTATVSAICAGLVGPKGQSDASPLRILAAAVVQMPSAAAVRAVFEDAARAAG